MKALVVGGGGREHALAWKLRQDDAALELLAAPGNPGVEALARCVPVPADDLDALAALAERERVDLTLVGPEGPLAAGIVDRFRARGLPIFGPVRAAAALESSKSFAKELMLQAGIPTARAFRHTDADQARRDARELGAPVVIKASGLAAGKGVVVCATIEEADAAIDQMLRVRVFGPAGAEILVEEYMTGEELSLFVLTDGERAIPMIPAQDHKRLLERDAGPNTGGMGSYAPVSTGTPALVDDVLRRVVEPALGAMRARGHQFTGLLYVGLMLTSEGPKVVEFNCRFGDPETQTLLPLMRGPLLPSLLAISRGEPVAAHPPLEWRDAHAVTTVVAAANYPGTPRLGDPVTLPPAAEDVHVFHAGTARGPDGGLVTAGGRVLAVTAVAATLAEAQRRSAEHAASVTFPGRQYRRDIGWRELRRHAGAA